MGTCIPYPHRLNASPHPSYNHNFKAYFFNARTAPVWLTGWEVRDCTGMAHQAGDGKCAMKDVRGGKQQEAREFITAYAPIHVPLVKPDPIVCANQSKHCQHDIYLSGIGCAVCSGSRACVKYIMDVCNTTPVACTYLPRYKGA